MLNDVRRNSAVRRNNASAEYFRSAGVVIVLITLAAPF